MDNIIILLMFWLGLVLYLIQLVIEIFKIKIIDITSINNVGLILIIVSIILIAIKGYLWGVKYE